MNSRVLCALGFLVLSTATLAMAADDSAENREGSWTYCNSTSTVGMRGVRLPLRFVQAGGNLGDLRGAPLSVQLRARFSVCKLTSDQGSPDFRWIPTKDDDGFHGRYDYRLVNYDADQPQRFSTRDVNVKHMTRVPGADDRGYFEDVSFTVSLDRLLTTYEFDQLKSTGKVQKRIDLRGLEGGIDVTRGGYKMNLEIRADKNTGALSGYASYVDAAEPNPARSP